MVTLVLYYLLKAHLIVGLSWAIFAIYLGREAFRDENPLMIPIVALVITLMGFYGPYSAYEIAKKKRGKL